MISSSRAYNVPSRTLESAEELDITEHIRDSPWQRAEGVERDGEPLLLKRAV